VLRSYPLYLRESTRQEDKGKGTHAEGLGDLLEAATEGLDAPDDVLNVVYAGEPDREEVEELRLVGWKGFAGEDLQKVAKIVPAGSVSTSWV
jgi:hypothetical protein